MNIGIMLRHIESQRGGIGTYTVNLLRNLFPSDRENRYFLFYRNSAAIGRYDGHPNVREIVVNSRTNLTWDQIAVPRAAKEHKIDLIFNPKLSVPIFASCKVVFVMHGGDWFVFPENYRFWDRAYHKLSTPAYFRRADSIISVSNSASADIVRHTGVDPRKLVTIYHGVGEHFSPIEDDRRRGTLRQKYNLPEKYLLYVGQIYPMKNFSGILKAFSALRKTVPYKLVVVGKPALKFEKELKLIDTLGLQEDVIRIGWVADEDLPAIYGMATALVFPSLYEGFGIPIIEAMACGCPVLTSNRGATAEVAGDAALLVEPTEVASISEGMHRLIEDADLRERLIAKGLRRCRDFTWENCAKRTIALFRKIEEAEPH
jgi:glycosyltransferase involved in cell wall biosynthesis